MQVSVIHENRRLSMSLLIFKIDIVSERSLPSLSGPTMPLATVTNGIPDVSWNTEAAVTVRRQQQPRKNVTARFEIFRGDKTKDLTESQRYTKTRRMSDCEAVRHGFASKPALLNVDCPLFRRCLKMRQRLTVLSGMRARARLPLWGVSTYGNRDFTFCYLSR
jgi:hypothetical protein